MQIILKYQALNNFAHIYEEKIDKNKIVENFFIIKFLFDKWNNISR